MRIIDLLIEHGLQELLLVGDPDQAIFEWNDARPELFLEKYHNPAYKGIELNENRRSSQRVCECTFPLSTLEKPSISVDEEVRDFPIHPQLVIYRENSIHETIGNFLELCQKNQIVVNPENVAVLGRGVNFIHSVLGTKFIAPNHSEMPKSALLTHHFFPPIWPR
jgi:superfamily I DNA/RNA helicase